MKVTMRNYNGTYAVFLEENGTKELVLSTSVYSLADSTYKSLNKKIISK